MWAADNISGVQTLVRVNNRTEEAQSYGSMLLHAVVPREMMLQIHTTAAEFHFFFVHGPDTQLWVNAGDASTFSEWMVGDWGRGGGDPDRFWW